MDCPDVALVASLGGRSLFASIKSISDWERSRPATYVPGADAVLAGEAPAGSWLYPGV